MVLHPNDMKSIQSPYFTQSI